MDGWTGTKDSFPSLLFLLPYRVTVDVQPSAWDSPEEARSVITLSCVDRPNLLDSITRIISRLSSTIVDADIMTSRYVYADDDDG